MTLQDLIADFRVRADDQVEPHFWSDEWLTVKANEAVQEAAIRSNLLHESDDPAVCEIAVVAGTSTYGLHPALYEIDHLSIESGGRRYPVKLVSAEALDDILHDWRQQEGMPTHAIQDDQRLRLVPRPTEIGTLRLEGYRLPMEPMEEDDDEPGIHKAHHRMLVEWMLHCAFSIPDAETVDKDRGPLAEKAFTTYFGLRKNSDLWRSTHHDTPHVTRGLW